MSPHVVVETIVAVSTPPGRGGIGIVRVTGPASARIVARICGECPPPRTLRYTRFRDEYGQEIDAGMTAFYCAPHSYTGDDVAEFQAHGNPIILQQLLALVCRLGARLARPGEFTERAFLNNKMDLAQAEAVADLIDSQTERAARAAQRTLRGEFANAVDPLIETIHLARAALEASIDFADDVHADDLIAAQSAHLAELISDIDKIVRRASQGARLATGATVAIIGAANVGKSSLLNALAGEDRAIVSDIAGTTRDVINSDIAIADIPVRLLDTAGLRATDNTIESEGIARAWRALESADLAIVVTDDPTLCHTNALWQSLNCEAPPDLTQIIVHNKIDLHDLEAGRVVHDALTHVFLSALRGDGLDLLSDTIAGVLGFSNDHETEFTARARHLDALRLAQRELCAIDQPLLANHPELAAEHYREASLALEAIGGRYSSEDLLGDIFSRFCIGK